MQSLCKSTHKHYKIKPSYLYNLKIPKKKLETKSIKEWNFVYEWQWNPQTNIGCELLKIKSHNYNIHVFVINFLKSLIRQTEGKYEEKKNYEPKMQTPSPFSHIRKSILLKNIILHHILTKKS